MAPTILPYRNPIVQAKMLACIDVLSGGRLICGVGVGWLEMEFQTGRVDEMLPIMEHVAAAVMPAVSD
jgi:alkanesulfonate monooxygenase SsuD/methylene tetrahydromethanopterin reductase-like flavin-dependent oxidoreductase (luciferase family)